VIVNPVGGRGAGRKVFTTVTEPLLKAASISYTMRGVVLFYSFVLAGSGRALMFCFNAKQGCIRELMMSS
jgi:hypothetical protein